MKTANTKQLKTMNDFLIENNFVLTAEFVTSYLDGAPFVTPRVVLMVKDKENA